MKAKKRPAENNEDIKQELEHVFEPEATKQEVVNPTKVMEPPKADNPAPVAFPLMFPQKPSSQIGSPRIAPQVASPQLLSPQLDSQFTSPQISQITSPQISQITSHVLTGLPQATSPNIHTSISSNVSSSAFVPYSQKSRATSTGGNIYVL